ncbi:MAG: hypothetical protein ACRC1T_09720 [Clostridium chrysemydis]|uniref:hypothetical protein n=1 Tax=Clostridium chrysemydis TaxID=2665504 RepID=UPI003F2E8133
MARKSFLAKCSKKHVKDEIYLILDHNNVHRATIDEKDKTIRLNKDKGFEYHTQLIRDLYFDYEEKELYIKYF